MKVIGITGSNGKTSTKDILAGILSQHYVTQKTMGNFNNEIGVPLTLLSLSENVEAAVVEMGMENLGELSFLTNMVKPDIAIITQRWMCTFGKSGIDGKYRKSQSGDCGRLMIMDYLYIMVIISC